MQRQAGFDLVKSAQEREEKQKSWVGEFKDGGDFGAGGQRCCGGDICRKGCRRKSPCSSGRLGSVLSSSLC